MLASPVNITFVEYVSNNINGEYAHLRDSFFGIESHYGSADLRAKGNGEIDYLKQILENSPRARELHQRFLKMNPKLLYDKAMELITLVDMGQVKNEELEMVEAQIALLLAGIEDLHLVKTLELTLGEEDLGMSR